MLFAAEFYPAQEVEQQTRQYFDSPDEDDITAEGETEIIHRVEMQEKERSFLIERVEAIAAKRDELDDQINQVAYGWKTRRMGRVELTILRQALYEMKYDDQVPEKVAINEAVDLAKKFGGRDSAAFINGVLAKLVTAELYARNLFGFTGEFLYQEYVCPGFRPEPDFCAGRGIQLQVPYVRAYLFYFKR